MNELLQRIAAGQASEAELIQFREKLDTLSILEQEKLLTDLGEQMKDALVAEQPNEVLYQRILANIHEEESLVTPVVSLWKKSVRWVAAAVVILVAGAAIYYSWPASQSPAEQPLVLADVLAPTKTKATITLGNGQQVLLDELAVGSMKTAGIVNASKNADGVIAYQPSKDLVPEQHTVTNPMGSGPVTLLLSDGTRVWLNAASSISYPSVFTGNSREVTMEGEAFFEVVHNAAKPFKVKVGKQTIEDIGTSFNVNAYDDEPVMKTTLVEGIVKQGNLILQPGEQALVNPFNNTIVKKTGVNMEAIVAWKNGVFNFDRGDIAYTMRILRRWYGVDIRYEKGVPNGITFSGDLPRTLTLTQVLKGLERDGLHFKIENGKTVVVSP